MKRPEEGFRIRLKRDLTRAHPSLRIGAEGTTLPPAGRSAIDQDRYLRCSFPQVEVDILFHDLEIIDERWIKWQEEEREAQEDALANHVAKATLWTAPRGGFVELVVEYTNKRPSDHWKRRTDCRKVLESLASRNLVETVVKVRA